MRLLIPALLAATLPANAQEQLCGPASAVQGIFTEQFSAEPLFEFTTGNGAQIIVVVNQESGRWVMVARRGGLWCFIDEGQGFTPYDHTRDGV